MYFFKRSLHERDEFGGKEVVRQKIYVCELCGKNFQGKRGYEVHMAIHRGDPNPYTCPRCPLTFPDYESLQVRE